MIITRRSARPGSLTDHGGWRFKPYPPAPGVWRLWGLRLALSASPMAKFVPQACSKPSRWLCGGDPKTVLEYLELVYTSTAIIVVHLDSWVTVLQSTGYGHHMSEIGRMYITFLKTRVIGSAIWRNVSLQSRRLPVPKGYSASLVWSSHWWLNV